jgi:hypothetical protein
VQAYRGTRNRSTDGSFSVEGLPLGSYYVTVLESR